MNGHKPTAPVGSERCSGSTKDRRARVALLVATCLLAGAMCATGWYISQRWRFYRAVVDLNAPAIELALWAPWNLRVGVLLAVLSSGFAAACCRFARGCYRAAGAIEICIAAAFVGMYLVARTGWSPSSVLLRWAAWWAGMTMEHRVQGSLGAAMVLWWEAGKARASAWDVLP